MINRESTICAIATPAGTGAIAVIRVSGPDTFSICDKIVELPKKISEYKSHTIHLCKIKDQDGIIDEVLISIFKAPRSYTGEDTVEISCHGSYYIQQKIIELLLRSGAYMAQPGEFTLRAFLNGKMDLSQAEAVADLIQSTSKASHRIAISQMRGEFSKQISQIREQLIHFASLIELELDFSEEDVEFADRKALRQILVKLIDQIKLLTDSFQYGNVIKKGVPVAIIGRPNVGKSTLLNTLLNEDKALVSDIPGTTRDSIEDTINIEGVLFRFIDTAGIRHTTDTIESMGIERTISNVQKATIILYLIDPNESSKTIEEMISGLPLQENQFLAIVVNKTDRVQQQDIHKSVENLKYHFSFPIIAISAKNKINIDQLHAYLLQCVGSMRQEENDIVITNARHYEALMHAREAAMRMLEGFDTGLPIDLIAEDLRQILYYLGSISGTITNDEILGNIFKNFCIGK
ncbi:MAG: tRNA uridine-5-carboxymethylaminomethyl(34) synthesis GTPase MnmE [Bacteroidales bacterium]|nr:tRNA uridine-5-carboxymethylaminomethyl(34) synthesis GTPase MnmE [Bacteroidales bacterium]